MYLTRCGMEPPYEEVQGPAKLLQQAPLLLFIFFFWSLFLFLSPPLLLSLLSCSESLTPTLGTESRF